MPLCCPASNDRKAVAAALTQAAQVVASHGRLEAGRVGRRQDAVVVGIALLHNDGAVHLEHVRGHVPRQTRLVARKVGINLGRRHGAITVGIHQLTNALHKGGAADAHAARGRHGHGHCQRQGKEEQKKEEHCFT